MEFTGSLGSIDSWGLDGWGDTIPTTATTCTQARWQSDGYEYDGSAWTELGWVTGQGSWDSGTSTCTFVWNDDNSFALGTGITKVRVATWAYAHTRDGDIKKKARSWVMGTPCK